MAVIDSPDPRIDWPDEGAGARVRRGRSGTQFRWTGPGLLFQRRLEPRTTMKALLLLTLAAACAAPVQGASEAPRETKTPSAPDSSRAASPAKPHAPCEKKQAAPEKRKKPAKGTERPRKSAPLQRLSDEKLAALHHQSARRLKELEGKIEADHAAWEKLDQEKTASTKALADLRTALTKEEARAQRLAADLARLEKGHNEDHDEVAALTRALAQQKREQERRAQRRAAIERLEKQAAELQRQADELRKKAEALRD